MELRYKKEAAVGLLLILGTVSFLFLMMWLRNKSFGTATVIPVMFEDVMGLKEGDPVRTSGVRVGQVMDIVLEAPGRVRVELEVRDGPEPKADARARILSQDLFGARYIEYDPGRSDRALPADSALLGSRAQDMNEMAEVLAGQGRALMDTTAAVAQMVSRELRLTLRNTQALLSTLNSGAGASSTRLVGALEDLRRALQRVDLLVEQNGPAATETINRMRNVSVNADSITRSLARASAQFDSVIAKVNAGQGAAGALVNDSTVMRDLMATNTALRELLTDFRANPGRYIRLRLF